MRIVVVLFVVISLNGFSQVSYDFTNPLPPEGKILKTVSKSQFGIYSSNNVDIDYEFNKEGIYALSIIYNSISRETIRESSKYHVKDGYLFGVTLDDSIPCELQGEYYHFGVKFKEQIIGEQSKNILIKIKESTYALNFEENGHYTPSLIQFKGKELSIQHFTYEDSTSVFNEIALKTEVPSSQMTYITLEPTLTEWNAISRDEILGNKIVFTR